MGQCSFPLPGPPLADQHGGMSKPARLQSTLAATLMALGLCLGSTQARAAAPPEPLQVLVFWGSWCGNCPALMREMEALRQQFAGRNVEFVAVSLEGEAAPQQYLARKGYGFRLKTDGDALLARYQAVGVPWVVVTDTRGKALANPSARNAPQDVAEQVRLELDLRS